MTVTILVLAAFLPQSTWYVDSAGTAPGTGTQADPYTRVDYAAEQTTTMPGDTLQIAPGVYPDEQVDLSTKHLILVGPGAELAGPPLVGPAPGPVIKLHGTPTGATVLDGLTLRGTGGENLGGVTYGGGLFVYDADVTVMNCEFRAGRIGSNFPTSRGGGAFVGGNSEGVIFQDCSFLQNRASFKGAGIHIEDSTVQMNRCSFGSSWVFIGGGHLSAERSTVSLLDCYFGATYVPGSPFAGHAWFQNCTVIAESCLFEDPDTTDDGGVHVYRGTSSWTGCTFQNYTTCQRGAGIWARDGDLTITDSQFLNLHSSGGCIGSVYDGGAILFEGLSAPGMLTVRGSAFLGNRCDLGGAISARGAFATIEDCLFEANQARGAKGNSEGGALALHSPFEVRNCRFVDNECRAPGIFSALSRGGAMAAMASGEILGCEFVGNYATDGNGMAQGARGGAIYASAPLVMRHSILRNNRLEGQNSWEGSAWFGPVEADHCTLYGHSSEIPGVAVMGGEMEHTIVWGNSDADLDSAVNAQYCLVEDGAAGPGNLSSDPSFWDTTDFYLQPDSAAIDAGNPMAPRDPDGTLVDLGARPFDPTYCGAGCQGALGVTTCMSAPNATGAASTLVAFGNPAAQDNLLVLHATGLPASVPGYFLGARGPGFLPGFGGSEGVLCLGPPVIVRFNQTILVSSTNGAMTQRLDLGNFPNQQVVLAGDTWHFQGWHRDWNGIEPTSNTTSALMVDFL